MLRVDFDGLTLATFSVDEGRRTMRGLVAPWDRVGAHENGDRWKFARGSLKYVHDKFVRFFEDHNPTRSFGRAIASEETEDGLVMTFSVNPGPYGDRLLQRAKSGEKTGLSVEVEADESDITADPADPAVRVFNFAHLLAVSLVEKPAFTHSRLISVTASRDERSNMDNDATTEPQAPAAPAVAPDVAAFMSAFMTAYPLMTQGVPAAQPTGPAVVDATRSTAQTHVTEPTPYRFDRQGNIRRGTHEFSVDLFNASKGDKVAEDRALDFIRAQFDIQTTDVNELNPDIQRPDLYVDELQYATPIWNAIRKGVVNEITPMVVPKFNAASGLVGDHVEGTEPTGGSLTATSQTITPQALSGKVHITREAWDQGGNPALSVIVWRQMVRAWNEGLETKSANLLASFACTGTGSVIAAGADDEALDLALTTFLAGLQFDRGGFRYRDFVLNEALYTALANARDGNNRKLFASIGSQNATGTVSQFWAALNLNGLVGVPAWALPTSASAYSSSYLFDREDIYAVASTPQRLEFAGSTQAGAYAPVAMVDIAIWGYFAGAVLRTCGPIKVMYDPTS